MTILVQEIANNPVVQDLGRSDQPEGPHGRPDRPAAEPAHPVGRGQQPEAGARERHGCRPRGDRSAIVPRLERPAGRQGSGRAQDALAQSRPDDPGAGSRRDPLHRGDPRAGPVVGREFRSVPVGQDQGEEGGRGEGRDGARHLPQPAFRPAAGTACRQHPAPVAAARYAAAAQDRAGRRGSDPAEPARSPGLGQPDRRQDRRTDRPDLGPARHAAGPLYRRAQRRPGCDPSAGASAGRACAPDPAGPVAVDRRPGPAVEPRVDHAGRPAAVDDRQRQPARQRHPAAC